MGLSVNIVGGGLAGVEAAWQALKAGLEVNLHEMRPAKTSAAHRTGGLAELVCSNSLKSVDPDSAPGLLKAEMMALDSLVIRSALAARVPAGQALAVDRDIFSAKVSECLEAEPGFRRVTSEVTALPADLSATGNPWIIATGPLTTKELLSELSRLAGGRNGEDLYFYDAIAPVIATDSIDLERVFRASRYGRNQDSAASEGDYLNVALNRDEYEAFVDAILGAEYMPLHTFEEPKYFEACLPIEVLASRGRDTLRFGPMKPVGLTDPTTGQRPWATIQLRQENLDGTMFSMVGFQTKMKWPEQKRVFSRLRGLENAEFVRYGSVHRNSYINSPRLLNPDLSLKTAPGVYVAGQLSGVEGYVESAAMGLLAGRFAAATVSGRRFQAPPRSSMMGALHHYVTQGGLGAFQPMNANHGLLPAMPRLRKESKQEKKSRMAARSRSDFAAYLETPVP